MPTLTPPELDACTVKLCFDLVDRRIELIGLLREAARPLLDLRELFRNCHGVSLCGHRTYLLPPAWGIARQGRFQFSGTGSAIPSVEGNGIETGQRSSID